METQDLYSIPQFLQRNPISRAKLYEEIKEGRLRVTKIGTRTLIAREDGDAWRNALRAATEQPR